MGELEDKLNTVLNNPQLMQQLMSMAQSISSPTPEKAQEAPREPFMDLDPNMLKKLSGFAQKGNIDSNQRSLLAALGPYLARERIHKLEKAMRAARMAQLASVFLNSTQFQSGR